MTPMTAVSFTVTFHSWFRVGALLPRDGLDAAVDHIEPLPSDHLRGLMRAQASTLVELGHVDASLVREVFGTTSTAGAWTWLPVNPHDDWAFSVRSRVSIDPGTHAAQKDYLLRAEVAWTPTAAFAVRQVERLEPSRLARHVALLRLAGCAVHHVGSQRRRGLGLVTVITDPPPSLTDLPLVTAGNPATAAVGVSTGPVDR